jgi:hypothetical protein
MQWQRVKSLLLLKSEFWLYSPQPFSIVTGLTGHNSNSITSGPHVQLHH